MTHIHTIEHNGKERAVNVWLEEIDRTKDVYRVRLDIPKVKPKTGIFLAWPVNPEFTGEHGIAEQLNRTAGFEHFNFV